MLERNVGLDGLCHIDADQKNAARGGMAIHVMLVGRTLPILFVSSDKTTNGMPSRTTNPHNHGVVVIRPLPERRVPISASNCILCVSCSPSRTIVVVSIARFERECRDPL